MDRTASFYSRPSYVGGAVYSGARRQRGGSVLGALKSMVVPIISGIGRSLKRNAINNAVGLATDVATDVVSGKNIKSSLVNRGKQRGIRTIRQTLSNIKQRRKGYQRLNKQRGSGKRKKAVKRKKPSRKRGASRKRAPAAKRRKYNF